MNETRIFCSVIIFTIGIYTIIVLQFELYKLNRLTSNHGGADVDLALSEASTLERHPRGCMKVIIAKSPIKIDRLNCGSTGDIVKVQIENCTTLPCDVLPNRNYSVSVNFNPSRSLHKLEIQTFARQRHNLKQLHSEIIQGEAKEDDLATLKFSFNVPPHPIFKPPKHETPKKCPSPKDMLYMLGVEIWDMDTGIGEICLSIPVIIL